ncbi:unnamed protein product [Prunus armeniaca]|uniref:Uncharacterized protein n=1 Tax=Prunus armeniaca TaxID=36596 RepID=A0A6J5VLJ1_PRUAR|nr:unnamed protein product [Prunus armeniaca]
MGERPGGSIRDHGQDPPPPVLHPVTKVFDKNDDEDLWIRISLPLTTNVVTITTFRIVDEGEGSCIIKTLHSTSTSVSASLQIVRITNLKEEEEKKKKKQRASLRVCFTTGTSGKERQREAPDQKKSPPSHLNPWASV